MVAWGQERMKRTLRVLGIETSCDETAAAVVVVSRKLTAASRKPAFALDVLSNVVASQVKIHAKYGGVVPEVAAREHVTAMIPTIAKAIIGAAGRAGSRAAGQAALNPFGAAALGAAASRLVTAIDAIAVTAGPGLITSLSVGVETARTLAYAWGKPLVAVNHIEGHVLSALLPQRGASSSQLPATRRGDGGLKLAAGSWRLEFPVLALIVSGGHTELLLMRGWGRYECIGATRDDAAGEAFDKVGKLLGLAYPGGPAVARAAIGGDPKAFDFPRGMLHSKDYEFSFSGLKTAVRYLVEGQPSFSSSRAELKAQSRDLTRSTGAVGEISRRPAPRNDAMLVRDICASFQQAVVDVLVSKTIAAAQHYRVKTILLGGGVAANRSLREQLGVAVRLRMPNTEYRIPNTEYTGDNAAMIAAAGGVRLLLGKRMPWEALDVDSNWELGRL